VTAASADEVRSKLVGSFLEVSRPSVEALVHALGQKDGSKAPAASMVRVRDGRREEVVVPGSSFRLRTSVEYASPQVTLEEFQGILLARLLEVTATYLADHPTSPLGEAELREIARPLSDPPKGRVVPFLMNVDDIEPDRYSINPLRRSIIETKQSGRAVADVVTEGLRIDHAFVKKYHGSLVADSDVQETEAELARDPKSSYVDFVDRVKYGQLARLSAELDIDLAIPSFRMPLATLRGESRSGPLHRIISACHTDLDALTAVYRLFGREITHRKTLLPAVPHSPDGLASKRAAHGVVSFEGSSLHEVDVHFGPTPLYPNEVDRADVAVVEAEARLQVPAGRLAEYDFRETPASPQFAIYMIASPEDGAIWHGVGKYAGMQIVQSYTNFHRAFGAGELFPGVPLHRRPAPPQWDIVAGKMLLHPKVGNIDASIGCVPELPRHLMETTHLRVLTVPLAGAAAAEAKPAP
jgi:hypothetical protein